MHAAIELRFCLAAERAIISMSLRIATMSEPKQMEPKLVVIARLNEATDGFGGIAPAPTKYHVATQPLEVT